MLIIDPETEDLAAALSGIQGAIMISIRSSGGEIGGIVGEGFWRRMRIKARARRYVRSSKRTQPWRKLVRRI
jgi:hypothetical protein